MKAVAADVYVGNGLRNLGHMTGDAFIAGAARLMMRVRLDRGGVWSGLCVGAMTAETQRVAGLAHHGDILGAMRIVAAGACDAARIHQALHEIVALHAVFMRGAVRKVRKGEIAELMFFERGGTRSVERQRTMAVQTYLVRGFC